MPALIRFSVATLLVILFTAGAIINNANAQAQIGGELGSIGLSTTLPPFAGPPPLDPNSLTTTPPAQSAPASSSPKAAPAQAAPEAAAPAEAAKTAN